MKVVAPAIALALSISGLAGCGRTLVGAGDAGGPGGNATVGMDGGPGGAAGVSDADDSAPDDRAADAGNDGGVAGASDAGDASADETGAGGRSAGCDRTLAVDDVRGKFVAHAVTVPGLADVYLPGGAFYQSSGTFDLSNRPYGVRLPAAYDASTPTAITFEAGACGNTAANFVAAPFSDLVIDQQHTTIEVALTYIKNCFQDGGPAIGNRDDSPEVPYFRAVLADVEARFCVDARRVFVAGEASGAWDTQLLSCAAADVIRGIATIGGGLRTVRPACGGPVAALLVQPTNDATDPLGPLAPTDAWAIQNGSLGQLPLRDDILKRNGCVGMETAPWNAFSACVRFTGCPAELPVVWCPITSSRQAPSYFLGVNYASGPMWTFLSTLP